MPLEEILNHRRRLLKYADTRRDVHAQHDPQQPELWRAEGRVHFNVMRRDQCGMVDLGNPSRRLPTLLRHAYGKDPYIMNRKYRMPIVTQAAAMG